MAARRAARDPAKAGCVNALLKELSIEMDRLEEAEREYFRHKYRPDAPEQFESWQDEAADSAGVPRFGEI